jgi:hypothetical protein
MIRPAETEVAAEPDPAAAECNSPPRRFQGAPSLVLTGYPQRMPGMVRHYADHAGNSDLRRLGERDRPYPISYRVLFRGGS